MHSYLLRLPAVFSSRDADAIVDRIQKDKISISGFNFFDFKKLFVYQKNSYQLLDQLADPLSTKSPKMTVTKSRSNYQSYEKILRNQTSKKEKS